MYLARFFHRSPHDADRRLVLASNGPQQLVMDTLLGPGGQRLSCESYADVGDAIGAFRIASRALEAESYSETIHVDYTLDQLPANPEIKPAWQHSLDEAFLQRMLSEDNVDNVDLSRLSETTARDEPFYAWLVAQHRRCDLDRPADFLTAAVAAQEALARRLAADAPFYAWSLRALEMEAGIYSTLCEALLADGQAQAALAAIRHACAVGANPERAGRKAWIQCMHFPEQEEDAFDQAYRYAKFGGFDPVVALPAYEVYVQRREAPQSAPHSWRWGAPRTPLSAQELQRVEEELGLSLSEDYRRFLTFHMHEEIIVYNPRNSAVLRFFDAGTLEKRRKNFVDFLAGGSEAAETYLHQSHGLSLRELLPIAEAVDCGNCLLLHLGAGERYGQCYRWSHEDAWDPIPAGGDFDAMLAALTQGFAAGDTKALDLVGLSS